MPVLEGALARSVELAAAMDSRGYGRVTDVPTRTRRITSGLVFAGVLGVCVGIYGLLDASTAGWLGLPMLGVGCLLAAAGLVLGGMRTRRTRYRPDPWAVPEWLVAGSGVLCATGLFVVARQDPNGMSPPYPLDIPQMPLLALLGVLVALVPAFAAPPPPDRVSSEPAQPAEATPEGIAA
jgi:energy-coupling factor transport system permease protein